MAEPTQRAFRVVIQVLAEAGRTPVWLVDRDRIIPAVVDVVQRVVGNAMEGGVIRPETTYYEDGLFRQVVHVHAWSTPANLQRARAEPGDLVARMQGELGALFGLTSSAPVVQVDADPQFTAAAIAMMNPGPATGPDGRTVHVIHHAAPPHRSSPTPVPPPPLSPPPLVERTMYVQQPLVRMLPLVLLSATLGALVVATVFLVGLLVQSERTVKELRTELRDSYVDYNSKVEELRTCAHEREDLDHDFRTLQTEKRDTDAILQKNVEDLVACATQHRCPKCEVRPVVPKRESPAPWEN